MSELHSLVNGCIRDVLRELTTLESQNSCGNIDSDDDKIQNLKDKLAALRAMRDIVERLL